MLWTFFKFFIAVWILRTVFLFGESAVPIVLAVLLMTLAVRLVIHHTSLRSGRTRDPKKFTFIGKRSNSPVPLESNAIGIHNKIKEQYL